MKLKRKTIANFVIVLLLVLSLVLVVVACGDNPNTDNGGNNPPVGNTGDENTPPSGDVGGGENNPPSGNEGEENNPPKGDDENNPPENVNIPIYQGMTVSRTQRAFALTKNSEPTYTAAQNEDIYITIHFDNPDNYVILSFTINNVTFSSYMFEYGSDMENIIIKQNVGNVDGSTEYTIDAIKYVDGSDIKDVIIGGDRTIKVLIEYSIYYHLNGGTNSNPYNYTIESDTITFIDSERTGYTFMGWYKDSSFSEQITSISQGSIGNVDIYAKWEIITYTITYHLDGGENNEQNPTSYTVETRTNLAKATKDDYTFMGWYTDADFTEQIERLNYGNLDLYAKWAYGTEGLSFRLENDSYTVTGYNGTSNNVAIPDEWNGLPVSSIGDYAFRNCSSLTSIEIPSSVNTIGSYAFRNCSSLTSIEIPSSVTSIGYGAFDDCSSLTSIEIPSSITTIGDSAFEGCSSLTSIEIPSSVTSIGNSAFEGCNSLTSIEIPSSVTTIGDGAFEGCSGLTSIEIPSSVTSIGWGAFSGCSIEHAIIPTIAISAISKDNLKTVIINGGESIGDRAFSGRESLTSIEIPSSITTIGYSAFDGCSSLTSVVFGANSQLTTISGWAFDGCSSLASVVFGANSQLTTIEPCAFQGCSSLTSIEEIPSSVTSIEWNAFHGCSSLKTVYYGGTAEQWNKISIGSNNGYLTDATRYYYSETKSAGCWHYNDEGKPEIWDNTPIAALTPVAYSNTTNYIDHPVATHKRKED